MRKISFNKVPLPGPNSTRLKLFLIFYSIFRFLIEYLREPDFHLGLMFNLFSMGQLLCVPFLLVGIWILVRK